MNKEDPIEWTPEKFAVYTARCLDARDDSPFKGHIKVTAMDGKLVALNNSIDKWVVSTATIVEGVLSLITDDAKADRDKMFSKKFFRVSRHDVDYYEKDSVPLRGFYMSGKSDEIIYSIVRNIFCAVENVLCNDERKYSLFHKTVGIKAVFLVLRELLTNAIRLRDVSARMWANLLVSQNRVVRFNDGYLFGSSGTHVGRVRDMLFLMTGHFKITDFKGKDCYAEYERLWNGAEVIDNA